ncbi:Transposon Tf2-11 polyprotein [Thelohanellus kitauei]|uniref:Transposon Tf2-11 polyprotein n=1 Tax=Thelohanellus kitauei TaxID=669202 RepID=A0A0C2MYA0_THEKT|nr:Transposon Tf2-11 polyprotein [Thelohanellus kitauei]
MCNGLVERYNKKIKEILRSLIKDDPQTWDDFIDCAMLSLQASKSRTTRHTPAEIIYGNNIVLPIDLVFSNHAKICQSDEHEYVTLLRKKLDQAYKLVNENSEPNRKEMKSYYDKNATTKFYNIGDYVLINKVVRGKLDPLFDGPFKIIAKNHPVYDVENIYNQNERIRAHFNRFVPCASPESRSMQGDVPPAQPTVRRSQRIAAQNTIPDYSSAVLGEGEDM